MCILRVNILLQMVRCLLSFILGLFMVNAYGQDIDLYQQFNGRYSYTAIGNTLNQAENNLVQTFCETLPSSSATLNLAPSQNILAAFMYWAGSGPGDTNVSLNGQSLDADETFNVTYEDPNFGDLIYFSCFKEITDIIQATGNGVYTLSDLDISSVLTNNIGYCRNRTNFAGWSIFVIYEESSLPLNQVSVYHGLEIINRNVQSLNITLDNLNVLDNDGAKIGFLAWEGDNALNIQESLVFNGNALQSLPLNPATNAFNGTNSFSGSNLSYNMDLDVYDIENFINIGDTSATIRLTTAADLIIINNVVTVLNSQLPDATIQADNIRLACDNLNIEVDYTVYNTNSTDVLPGNVPIAFYADGALIGNSVTVDPIPIGGSESGTINLSLPEGISNPFTLTMVVDDLLNGLGTIPETNESNNTTVTQVTLLTSPVITDLPDIVLCDIGNNTAEFDLTVNEHLLNLGTNTLAYYYTEPDAQAQVNEIIPPTAVTNTTDPQTVYLRVDNTECFQIAEFDLRTRNCPPWVPQGFSPDGDGINDLFEIPGLQTIFEDYELKIYNRYGTLIYEGGSELGLWNGRSNRGIGNVGALLPVGTYYYVLHLNDPDYDKPLVGWVYMNY